MTTPALHVDLSGQRADLRVTGSLVTEMLGSVERAFADLTLDRRDVRLDISGLDGLDTGGAWMIADLKRRLGGGEAAVEIVGATPERKALIDLVFASLPKEPGLEAPPRGLAAWLATVGENTAQGFVAAHSLLGFLGITLHRLGRTLIRPWRLRRAALFSQIEQAGLNAVPIVALMGFLIGVVLAFQGATQLRQFGAEVFVVDLLAISILRELGIMLTAIIVAGRSGSAFTAAIGSMKMREEIDAMRALGLDPIEVLVLPRVLALLVVLPILGFVANVAGLFGGALMSWIELDVSPGVFVTRLYENTDVWHLAVGMIKAPFFALIIAVVACWQAMLVEGSAESVGQRTTASVVVSIFLVIVIDALFSIFFVEMGI